MTIVDSIMTRRVWTVPAEATVRDAAREMKARKIGGLIVVKGGKAVGMLTERDLAHRVLAESRDPDATRVGDVMSSPLATVAPDEQVDAVAGRMRALGIKRLAVVLEGELRGIVTVTDIAHARPELSREFMDSWVRARRDE